MVFAVLTGQFIELEHCLVRHSEGEVTLIPLQGALCSVGNVRIHEPTKLNQGKFPFPCSPVYHTFWYILLLTNDSNSSLKAVQPCRHFTFSNLRCYT